MTDDALLARLDALEAEVRSLRSQLAGSRSPADPAPTAPPPGGPVGRRQALRAGLGLAGAAAAGAVLLDGAPAAAGDGNGDVMNLGESNSATFTTRLEGDLEVQGYGEASNAFRVLAFDDDANAIVGISSNGNGVFGSSATVGVRGTSTASSPSVGVGVLGLNGNGVAVQGAGKTGVLGSTSVATGFGVEASNTGGPALKARGKTYGVIAQSFTTNPDEAGLAASSINGMAIFVDSDSGDLLRGASTSGGAIAVSAPKFHLRLTNAEPRGAPTGDTTITHVRGDIVETTSGDLWLCVAPGKPGTWRKLAGPATAGAFHALPAPARVYDSRPGFAPTVGTKTPFGADTTRAFDLKVNGSGVPAGATAVMVNLLLVNAAVGNGNLTVWANGATKPVANTLVWGGDARRFSTLAVTTVDSAARCQVNTSLATDLVIDVVGFYR